MEDNRPKPDMDLEKLADLIKRSQIAPPPVTYSEVPKETREWLGNLRIEDLAEISEAIRFMRSARTVGRFGRWALTTFAAIFVSAVVFGEKFVTAIKWLGGSK